jgi:Ca2+-binding EF-hand superfamily protein
MFTTADAPKEIKILYKRFRRLDRSGRGTISADDLTMIPELAMNPLASVRGMAVLPSPLCRRP